MFDRRKSKRPPAVDFEGGPEEEVFAHAPPEYEYAAFTYTLAEKWNAEVNKLARQGWELVNGSRDGVGLYAFMRRKLRS